MKRNIVIFVLVILSGIGLIYFALTAKNTTDVNENQELPSTESEETPGYIVEEIPFDVEGAPDFNREIEFSSDIPAEARAPLASRAQALQQKLSENANDSASWYELAVIYHSAGDFGKAKDIWEFLTSAVPNDIIAYNNLGKLHHYSLKNYTVAESYFKKSLELDPSSLVAYLELHELYRYSYKTDSDLAVQILEEAIQKFPELPELYLRLFGYYRDNGQTSLAKETLLKGQEVAQKLGNEELVLTFSLELGRLK